jgi:hypothetical protein
LQDHQALIIQLLRTRTERQYVFDALFYKLARAAGTAIGYQT